MRTWRRRFAAGALALAAAVVTGMSSMSGAAVGSAGEAAALPAGRGAPDDTVTLITGDRVQLRGSSTPPAVLAGPGRAGMGFQIYEERGDTYVLPYDAVSPVSAGRVDRRLFNVTKLHELGYGDRSRRDVPLIVTGSVARLRSLDTARMTRALTSIGAAALREPKARAAEFWKGMLGRAKGSLTAGVTKIWLDGTLKATLDQSVPQIGAPAAWQAGHTGAGTKVAVLDTGIDVTHADLTDAVVEDQDFTGSESGTDDRYGHGTHVASTITGSGAASGGRYRGVAPDTELLNGKVLDDDGFGNESWVLAGMEWAVAEGADVVNLSLGSGYPADGTSPMDQAINRLTDESGTLFVVAAGNDGPSSETVSSPSTADAALAVGAVDKSDQLAPFSSRGPRGGDGAIKPDLTAPGVGIVAARSAHGSIGEPVGTGYTRLNGTSMATPHVAGAAAILAGQHPGWAADELKAALMGSAQPKPDLSVYEQGAGRVDVARATTQQLRASVGSMSLGVARWPHNDDQPVTRTVTYHNDGDHPVALTLSTDDIRDPQGESAPAGMFTMSAKNVTVPAHGSASADLVANPAVDGPDGIYSGALVATAGETQLRTLVALDREIESYDVTVRTVDWEGHSAPPESVRFVNVDKPRYYLAFAPPGTLVVRLPKGRYSYDSMLFRVNSMEPFSESTAYFVEPELAVTHTMTLTMDARDAVPIGFRTDQPEAGMGGYLITSLRDTAWGGKDSTGFWAGGTDIRPVQRDIRVRPSQTSAGGYHFDLEGLLARPDGAGWYTNSPYQYHLKWTEDGRVPATLDRRFRDRDLTELRTRVAAQVPGALADKDGLAGTTPPGTIVERYSPRFEFASGFVSQWIDPERAELSTVQSATEPRLFTKPGKAGTERWNVGPFMPGQDPFHSTQRTGNELVVSLMLYSDQNLQHAGASMVDSASTRLLRDGKEVASSDAPGFLYAEVPAGAATYQLETEAVRSNSPLTTRQSAAWTFRSDTTAEETPLPLMMIRFAPELDDRNQAPAGRRYAVPVHVGVQDGAAHGTVTSLTVDVSYDDGVTWHPAKMRGRTALLKHPRRAGYVSLRATATDSVGNKVEQTVIHAYRLRR